uniref:Uncharacterized protein n=1 Tax=Sparus aurata TaxID=8175 RepID=A0A671TK13_SPAAU
MRRLRGEELNQCNPQQLSHPLLQECIKLRHSDLAPLDSLLLLSNSSSPQAKRSYSRRPVKINTSNGVEEESAESFPAEMRKIWHHKLKITETRGDAPSTSGIHVNPKFQVLNVFRY